MELNGPRFTFFHMLSYFGKSKMDKMIQRLKIEAAQLGANGIVIEGTTNQTKQNVNHTENGTSISTSQFKTGTATAIFIKTF